MGASLVIVLLAVPFLNITSPDDAANQAAQAGGGGVEGPTDGWAPDAGEAREPRFSGGSAGTERVLEITEEGAGPKVPWKAFDGNPTKLYDIDGDGRLEIIAQNDNHWVYVFDSKSGRMLAELQATPIPDQWGARTFNGPEAAALQRGGETHIVTANSASGIAVYRFDPEESSSEAFVFEKLWDRRVNDCHWHSAMDAKVVLADLTLDGNLEILAATEDKGLYALRHDGELLWQNCLSGGNAAPVVADVDADGWPDVVHVSDGGVVALLDGRSGGWIWAYHIRNGFDLGSAAIPVMAAVGDLSGSKGLDIVVGVRDNHDHEDLNNNSALLLALDHRGQVLWSFQDPDGNPLTYTRPIIADADDDGENEVYWADWNTVGHRPPDPQSPEAWNRTGPAHFYRIDARGNEVWNRTLETWWNNLDLAIADLTGDGKAEVLANGPDHTGHDGIWYLDAQDGTKKAWVDLHPWKAQRGPVIADLWGSGTTQWVLQVSSNAPATGPAILVYDTQVPYDPVWPHLPDPVLEGFDAVFSGVRGDEWWAEVQVRGVWGQVERVDMQVDDGPWQEMQDEGWGWTASYQAPDGSMVRFRATSTLGDPALSDCYIWPDATKVQCPDGTR